MSENLFLGDANCPHTPAKTTIECEEFYKLMQSYRHSDLAKKHLMIDETIAAYYAVINYVDAQAADRIEQLERELAEAKKSHARYEYIRKLNVPQLQKIYTQNVSGNTRTTFDELIDAAINGVKA